HAGIHGVTWEATPADDRQGGRASGRRRTVARGFRSVVGAYPRVLAPSAPRPAPRPDGVRRGRGRRPGRGARGCPGRAPGAADPGAGWAVRAWPEGPGEGWAAPATGR